MNFDPYWERSLRPDNSRWLNAWLVVQWSGGVKQSAACCKWSESSSSVSTMSFLLQSRRGRHHLTCLTTPMSGDGCRVVLQSDGGWQGRDEEPVSTGLVPSRWEHQDLQLSISTHQQPWGGSSCSHSVSPSVRPPVKPTRRSLGASRSGENIHAQNTHQMEGTINSSNIY